MKYIDLVKKASSPAQEFVGKISGEALTGPIGIIPNMIGNLGGALQTTQDPNAKLKDLNQPNGAFSSMVPGIGGYRQGSRRSAVSAKAKGGKGKVVSQYLGGFSSAAFMALLGAIIGGTYNAIANRKLQDKDIMEGAISGAGIGAGASALATLISKLTAGVTPTRNWKEQKTYEQDPTQTAANYLVPGRAGYNYYKSLGRSISEKA